MARELDEELSNVSYHTKQLVEFECAELVSTRPVRGALEHFYRATERHLIDTEEWEELDPVMAEDLVCEIMQKILDDFVASAARADRSAATKTSTSPAPRLSSTRRACRKRSRHTNKPAWRCSRSRPAAPPGWSSPARRAPTSRAAQACSRCRTRSAASSNRIEPSIRSVHPKRSNT